MGDVAGPSSADARLKTKVNKEIEKDITRRTQEIRNLQQELKEVIAELLVESRMARMQSDGALLQPDTNQLARDLSTLKLSRARRAMMAGVC